MLKTKMRAITKAAFHCAACFVTPAGDAPIIAQGVWHGTIACERRGEGGFGYDPVFIDPELGISSAEMDAAQKNARSHRGKALAELARQLQLR